MWQRARRHKKKRNKSLATHTYLLQHIKVKGGKTLSYSFFQGTVELRLSSRKLFTTVAYRSLQGAACWDLCDDHEPSPTATTLGGTASLCVHLMVLICVGSSTNAAWSAPRAGGMVTNAAALGTSTCTCWSTGNPRYASAVIKALSQYFATHLSHKPCKQESKKTSMQDRC